MKIANLLNGYLKHTRGLREIDFTDYLYSVFSNEDGELPFQEKEDTFNQVFNPIAVTFRSKREQTQRAGIHFVVYKDLHNLSDILKNQSVILSPNTYMGYKRKSDNLREVYGFTIDLDYVDTSCLSNLFDLVEKGDVLSPNLITVSGTGVHLTYILTEPVKAFYSRHEILNKIKREITNKVWLQEVTTTQRKGDKIQYQPIHQGYRVIGTKTKAGDVVKAYEVNPERYTLFELVKWTKAISPSEYSFLMGEGSDELIIEKKEYKKRYNTYCYNWYKNLMMSEPAQEGFRYHRGCALVIAGVKSNIPIEVIKADLEEYYEKAKRETSGESWDKSVLSDMLKYYNPKYACVTRKKLEDKCGFSFPEPISKRNGRTQREHLKMARKQITKQGKKKGTKNDYTIKRDENGEILNPKNSKEDIVIGIKESIRKKHTHKELAEMYGLSEKTFQRWDKTIKTRATVLRELAEKDPFYKVFQSIMKYVRKHGVYYKSIRQLSKDAKVSERLISRYLDKIKAIFWALGQRIKKTGFAIRYTKGCNYKNRLTIYCIQNKINLIPIFGYCNNEDEFFDRFLLSVYPAGNDIDIGKLFNIRLEDVKYSLARKKAGKEVIRTLDYNIKSNQFAYDKQTEYAFRYFA